MFLIVDVDILFFVSEPSLGECNYKLAGMFWTRLGTKHETERRKRKETNYLK